MADRPILFSGPMVKAILDGRKSQTRRVLKPEPGVSTIDAPPCPYAPGDRLWVREAFRVVGCGSSVSIEAARRHRPLQYAADGYSLHPTAPESTRLDGSLMLKYQARSPIHMPRWASRITLTVTDVRVQRVQEISEADARAEGVHPFQAPEGNEVVAWTFKQSFARLWDSLNGKRPGCSWAESPWVAAISFSVARANIDQMAAP